MSKEDTKIKESQWFGRSLTNYKAMHGKLAESKGVGKAFYAATTLTSARKLAFGLKRGQPPVKKS